MRVGMASFVALAITVAGLRCGPVHSERGIDQASAASGEESPALPGDLPPPETGEVRRKIGAIFGVAAILSASHRPGFVAGDFNGDGSGDIAVIVIPTPGSLPEINNAVANWILKDVGGGPGASPAPNGESVRVERGEALLAVIHGYGPSGWRSAEARQIFLLRHAVGSALEASPIERFMSPPAGGVLSGDVIVETRDGRRGFLHWTGASYDWHPL